jgi:hypothetical protein
MASSSWHHAYTAQVLEAYGPQGPYRHLIVRRHDRGDTLIPWTVLQAIKNDMLGPEAWAVEIFPAEADVLNEANYRHLCEVPAGTVPNLRSR